MTPRTSFAILIVTKIVSFVSYFFGANMLDTYIEPTKPLLSLQNIDFAKNECDDVHPVEAVIDHFARSSQASFKKAEGYAYKECTCPKDA